MADSVINFSISCDASHSGKFIELLKQSSGYTQKLYLPVDAKCHNERYRFLRGRDKLSIVFDTKANIITLAARKDIVSEVRPLLETVLSDSPAYPIGAKATAVPEKSSIAPEKPAPLPAQSANKKTEPQKQPQKQQPKEQPKKEQQRPAQKQQQKPAPPAKPTPAPQKPAPATKPAPAPAAKPAPQKSAPATKPAPAPQKPDSLVEHKDGFSVKKFSLESMERLQKSLKKLKFTYKLEGVFHEGTDQQTENYTIKSGDSKVSLRFMPKKTFLQLQGKRSVLFADVQALVSKEIDYLSAVSSHIVLTGEEKKAGDMHKLLKKRLPDAFEYLSEQSKIDLTIGLIDITNKATMLTDYSSLLTPPYRGLEKLISDLQKAQGIDVKMIGQAYERENTGIYVLKLGYRKRIKSVIYAEVMSALYCEYFSRRNFYSHSDNSTESVARVIYDRKEVETIFDNLMDKINYNCKKLKEIGFSVK